MPLRMPVISNFPKGPASNSCGTAVWRGPDIEGIGRGIGAAAFCAGVGACGGFAGVGAPWSCATAGLDVPPSAVELDAAGEFESTFCCPKEGNAANAINERANKHVLGTRKT